MKKCIAHLGYHYLQEDINRKVDANWKTSLTKDIYQSPPPFLTAGRKNRTSISRIKVAKGFQKVVLPQLTDI